jgi:bifunctional non-homologous end joining protein LigD
VKAAVAASAAEEIRGVRVSHPDKLYWPEEGYTKRDLVDYYAAVFDRLRPYVKDRMLSLERCPDGMKGSCFFQKEKPDGLPKDTPTQKIQHAKKATNYVVGGELDTQLALANLGCIAVHVWGSRRDDPRKPDWVCFDLDPSTERFADAIRAALKVREALDALELVSFPKTSGGKGLHVFVPIRVGPDADAVLGFAEELGRRLAGAFPRIFTTESRIADRKGKLYLDPFRNGFAQTVVAPYSVRRRAGAPFSRPLSWRDVRTGLDPKRYNLGNYAKELAKKDPWADFWKARQPLERAMEAVKRL